MGRRLGTGVSVSIFLVLLGGGGCAAKTPSVPAGITIVEPEDPPLSEELIEEAQRRLRSRGLYMGFVDGEIGAETRIALVRLQRESGLRLTGRLDWATAAALGLDLPGTRPPTPLVPPPPQGEERLPSAAELLRRGEGDPLPQPPPDALAAQRRAAAGLLEEASRTAADELEAARLHPGESGRMLQRERLLREVQSRAAAAREDAFDMLVEARRAGGWALLPASLIRQLEEELARRRLLLAEPNGRLDSDDEAAIRWLERSLGLTPTGQPSARLFDELGIDLTPLFEE